jgi:hypothetical protein
MSTNHVIYQHRPIRLPTFRLTERDVAVLDAIHRYRMLERRQVERLFFAPPDGRASNTNRARERLRRLARERYLSRIPRPIYFFSPHPGPVYRLAQGGAKLLAKRTGLPLNDFYYWGRGDDQDWHQTQVSSLFLEHGLALAEVRIALDQSICAHHYTLELFQDDIELRRAREWDVVEVELSSEKKKPVRIMPDGFFILRTPRGRGHFFLEVDRSTESVKSVWQRKILGYKTYALNGQFQRRYGITQPNTALRVLTVTISQLRAEHLKAAAERYGPPEAASLFLFAPLSEVTQHDPLATPLWCRASDSQRHSLI